MNENTYKLKIPDHLIELIRGLHPHLKKKVRYALEKVVSGPYTGKALKEELAGFYSYRTGNFRIIYRISERKVIELVAVGPRRTIYEETLKIIRHPSLSSQSGVSAVLIVGVLLVLSILGAVIVSVITTESETSLNEVQSTKAFYIAQGGIEYGIYTTTRGGGSWGEFTFANRPIGNGSFTLKTYTTIVSGKRRMIMESVGRVSNPSAARKITLFANRTSTGSGGGGEQVTDGGFTNLVNWPDGVCPPNKNDGTVSIFANALSIASNTGKKKGMDDCRVQTLAASIPPSTNVVLSLNYKFDSNYTCNGASSNSTAKCLMSILFIYSDSTTETPWTNSMYPSAWTGSGNISWTTKAGVNLTGVRIKYDIESANQNDAQTTGWLDDVSLIRSGSGTIPIRLLRLEEAY